MTDFDLDGTIAAVSSISGVPVSAVLLSHNHTPSVVRARHAAIHIAWTDGDMTQKDIAEGLGLDPSSVSEAIKKMGTKLAKDVQFRELVQHVRFLPTGRR